MPVTDTPLRYPGGKSQLIPFVIELLRDNDLFYGEYAEPFAGGAGIALHLLLNDYVSRIYLNDFDPAIHAFWHSILHDTDAFCERIKQTEVNIDEWHRQRKVYFDPSEASTLDKGFATFFLNRTNRSGIIKAGVIGGLGQSGTYKLDCRFIKPDLIRKIKRVAGYREQIVLTCLDAAEFVRDEIPKTGEHTLVNLDPPYYDKGPELYTNFYRPADHAALAHEVANIDRHWMVTYDDTPEIRKLYEQYPCYSTSLNYSAQVKRIGTELLVLGPTLVAPESISGIRLHDPEMEIA